jgi:PAS domain S-box-containing protein
LWDWYVQSGVTTFNEQWANIIGYSLEELEPISIETWTKFGHPEDLQRSGALLQAHFRGETPFYECEARMQHKSGAWVWVLDRGKVVEWNADGTPRRMTGTHLDITERKKMEEQLRKSQEQYRIIAENTVDLIALHTTEGNYTYISPSVEMLLGYTPQEMLGKNPYQFFHPDDQERIREESHDLAIRGETNLTIAFRMRRSDGTYRWFETKTQPLFATGTSDVIALQTVTRDVTERKIMEDEILHAKQLLDEAGAMAHVGGWEYFIESTFMRVTSETYSIYGLPHDTELSVDRGISFYHPDDQSAITVAVEKLITQGVEFDMQLRFLSAAGEEKWVRSLGKCEMRDGKAHRVYGTIQDITLLVESQKQLQERERFISNLLETMPGAVFVYDFQEYRTIFATPSYYALGGYSAQEIQAMGAGFIEECHPDDIPTLRNQFAYLQSVESGVVADASYRVRTKDGAWKWLFTRYILLPDSIESRKSKQLLGVFLDISTLKEAEQELANAHQRLKTLLESVPFAIAVTRVSDGKPLFNNAPMQQMIGLSSNIEEHPYDNDYYVHPEDRPAIINELQTKGRINNKEIELRKPSGEHFWASLSILPIEFEGDQAIFSVFNDVTERKRSEEVLKKSRENLKEAQRLAKIGSWEWDILANSITWSEEQYRLFGETPETFQTTYEGYLSHLSAEEQARTNTLVSEVLEGKAEYHIEHEIMRKDGITFFAIEQGSIVRDESGKPIRMYGTTQDITERKQAENHLRRSEQQFRLIIESSPIPLALNDERGNITYLNTAFVKTFGYDTQDIPTLLEWWQAAYPDEEYREWVINSWQERFLAAEQTGEPFKEIELVVRAKNGVSHSVLASAAPLERSYHHLHLVILIDITERKAASEKLMLSEQRYRSFIELQGTYFVRTDLEGRYTYASPSMLKDYAQPDEHVIGKSGLHHIIPEDHDVARRTVEQCLMQLGTPVQVILRKPHVSGKIYVTSWEFIAITNGNGELSEIQCVGHDITDRVEAERLLMESEEKYRSMVHNIGDIITLLDEEGKILYESSSITSVLGYSETELVGQSMFEFVHPDEKAWMQRRFDNLVRRNHQAVNTEFRFRHRDDSYISLESQVNNQLDNPAIRAVIVNSRDITERKAMLSKLTEYSQELQNIIDSMLDGLLLLDEAQRIVMVNPALVEMFGYTADEFASMPLSMLMPERFRNKHEESVEGFYHTPLQRRRVRTALGRTSSGVEFPIDVSLASFMIHDKQMTLAIVRDITEQQQAHEEIMQLNKTLEFRVEERTRELVVLNNEKNEFMGIAAHDLKNPLAGILSSAQILERYFADDDSIKRCTEMIIAASDQMLDIIANLLDVNKIESGSVNLDVQSVDLDILSGIVVEYQARAAQKGIILYYEAPDRDTAWVYADMQSLRQILDNLISNAVKYSPQWKNVWVRVMTRTDETGRKFGRVEVQDEGPGISEADQQKLFRKFSRLTAQPTAGENSTGLGLSIVKKLVEMQHGSVWCESVLGKGATFILELPAVEFLEKDGAA